jgi:hypothetical protein
LQKALYGVGRKDEIGYYYNTAPKPRADSAPVKEALFNGSAKLSYFGTNWDGRRTNFFRHVGQWSDAEIYGPERSWKHLSLPQYKGELSFDGWSVIDVYRRNGIGLNIQGEHHVQEDVISNRVFEISAAGAVCLSCRMPWLEKEFGDSLYYFEQEVSDKRLLEEIRRLLDRVKKNPEEAWEKAQRARKIFEEKFTLEKLLKNTVDYHVRRQNAIASEARGKQPLVSVVICSDGKNIKGLNRALASVAAQERGRFQVALVKTAPFEHDTIKSPHITLEVVEAKSGTSPLWHGLKQAKGDYVALLDEAHEWFPQHIHRLLEANIPFAHTALVEERGEVVNETSWIKNDETRNFSHEIDVRTKDYRTAASMIVPCGFLAHKSLLDERLLDDPGFGAGASEYLIMCLMARAQPRQTFATTVLRHKAEFTPSNLSFLDATQAMVRLWREDPHTGGANRFIEELPAQGFRMRAWRYETERVEKDGVLCDNVKFPRFDAARLQPIPLPFAREQSFFHMGLTLLDDKNFVIAINTTEAMRGFAGFIAFPQMEDSTTVPIEYLMVIEAEVEKGQFGVQLLHNHKTLERYSVARTFAAGRRYRLEIPICYRPEINGLVIEVQPSTVAHIRSIRAFAEV